MFYMTLCKEPIAHTHKPKTESSLQACQCIVLHSDTFLFKYLSKLAASHNTHVFAMDALYTLYSVQRCARIRPKMMQ